MNFRISLPQLTEFLESQPNCFGYQHIKDARIFHYSVVFNPLLGVTTLAEVLVQG